MGEVRVSEGGIWWLGRYSIGIIGLQEDVICDDFDLLEDFLLYVVIYCEGKMSSETFDDDSIVE